MLNSALMDLERISSDDFRRHLGTFVTITVAEGQQLELEILAVRDLEAAARPGTARKAFAVEFKGPPAVSLGQQIYLMSHPSLGHADVFIVPIARDNSETRFEALFN